MSGAAWMLLVMAAVGGQSVSTLCQPFWTRDTCDAARDWFISQKGWGVTVTAECVLSGANAGTTDGRPVKP